MLSAELQAKIAEFAYALPSNTDVTDLDVVPEGMPVFVPDWAFVSRNRRDWIERFDRMMAS